MKCPICHSTVEETYIVINELEEVVKKHSLGKEYHLPSRVVAEFMMDSFEMYCRELQGIKNYIKEDIHIPAPNYYEHY